jgi:plasmid stabilization system protein ParE
MPTKFHVNITLSAEKDVEEIWTYIAADSPAEATKFILKLEDQVTTLEQFPQRCPLIPENALLGTENRHLLYGNYRTIFRIDGKAVYVLRIIHGARLLDSAMLET